MYLLRIWFLVLVAGIYSCSSMAFETTEYSYDEYEYESDTIICNGNQTKNGCNFQRCAIGRETATSLCEGNWGSCKCKSGYWLNSTDSCVLRKDCDVHPPYSWGY